MLEETVTVDDSVFQSVIIVAPILSANRSQQLEQKQVMLREMSYCPSLFMG